MSDGMGREPAYLSSHATNRYFIPNWGMVSLFGQRALVKADALSLFERGELNGVGVGITKKQYGHLHNVIFQIEC